MEKTYDDGKLARAAAHIGATPDADGWVYYARETSSCWRVSAATLASLCDYLDHADPTISGDAYSHWCAGSSATEVL
jgi:hypothetical protein